MLVKKSKTSARVILFLGLALCCALFSNIQFARASSIPLANYFVKWHINSSEARELAKWDLLILDMETQHTSRSQLEMIRVLNPNIKILAYITSQEIRNDAGIIPGGFMRNKLASGIKPEWYLKKSNGEKYSFWEGTSMLNITDLCPRSGGEKWNQHLAKFVAKDIMSSGLWDGVFYDNTWRDAVWFLGAEADLNGDGLSESDVDERWRAGMKELFDETYILAGANTIVVGNAIAWQYKDDYNGFMIENFQKHGWADVMNIYRTNEISQKNPRYNIINNNAGNNSAKKNDYKRMRFGLASALMENGYYSYDYGNQDHGQLWWYDEYDANLGDPIGGAKSLQKFSSYKPDVWQRDFEHGIVLANSTDSEQTIALDGDYEKLRGKQDPSVNDGGIVSEINLQARDGLVLLKSMSTLEDALFRNGDFIRFMNAKGDRVRSGFFAFDNKYAGGDQIAYIDIDGNGARDVLVAKKGIIEAWRDDGQLLLRVFPYTANYSGELRIALGDLNNDGKLEIAVAPVAGLSAPIKIFFYDGITMQEGLNLFDKKYKGGMSVAIGNDKGAARLVVGTGKYKAPRVLIYDDRWKLVSSWLAFDKSFTNGINVATGNIDGFPGDEVVVGKGVGGKPVIRVFDFSGKQLYPEFTAYQTFNAPGIEISTADVNFDGKDEIIAQSSGF